MIKIYVEINGPRPPSYELPDELWPSVDYDSDGDSEIPEATDWTELTITNRENEKHRIDIDLVSKNPLVLVVASEQEELAHYAANWLVKRAAGKITNGL